MTDFKHPFEEICGVIGPYKLIEMQEVLHPIAGYWIDGTPNPSLGFRAGTTCDLCGTAIRYAYKFSGKNADIKVGTDCAQKAYAHDAESLAKIKQELRNSRYQYYAEKRALETQAQLEARLAEERARNGGKTDAELAEEQAELDRLAAEAAYAKERNRRENSKPLANIGDKVTFTGTLVSRYVADSFNYFCIQTYITDDGDTVIYKGGTPPSCQRGERAILTGKVKSVDRYSYKDRIGGSGLQTRIERAKVLEILEGPKNLTYPKYDTDRIGTDGRGRKVK